MPAAVGVQGDGKLVAAGLTYFLVPTPSDNRFNINPFFLVSLAVLVVLAGAIFVRGRQKGSARSGGSRIGPAPGA